MGTHVVLGGRLRDTQADLFKNKVTSSYPFRKLKNKTRRVYTCQNVSIPSIPEIEDFETKLSDLHEENVSAQLVLSTRDCCIANLISFGNAGIWPQQWQKPALQGHFFQGFRRGVSYRGTIQK